MSETESPVFPIVGYDEKGEQLKEPIGYLTQDDLDVINRSRGTIKDNNGFKIHETEMTQSELSIVDKKDYITYEFPLPEHKWEVWKGRIKKLKWSTEPTKIKVYYNDIDKICYVSNGEQNGVKKYEYENVYPTDQELLEFQIIQNKYVDFLKSNDIDVEITSQGEMMNSFKLMDRWGHTDKVDVFSRITDEERKHIVLSRWIAATTWDPTIFSQIKGFLRLGHSVEELGLTGKTKRKSLIQMQKESLKETRRTPEDEEQGWGDFKK